MAGPVISSPADDAVLVSLNPIVTWAATIPASDTYEVQVATDAGFVSLVVNVTGITVLRYRVRNLTRETEYFLRVRGVLSGTPGDWSVTHSFTTGTAINVLYAIRILMGADITADLHGLRKGSFCYVTGSDEDNFLSATTANGYDDIPTNPVESASEDEWYRAFLIKDEIGNPSYHVNLKEGGDYGSMSGLSFSVRNTERAHFEIPSRLSKYIFENTLYLHRKVVEFYVIVDGIFTLWWSGEIEDWSYDELKVSFQCVDRFKSIHKDFPPEKLTREAYPFVKDDMIGKVVPVCIGQVTYAPLLAVSGNGEKKDVHEAVSSDRFQLAPIDSVTGYSDYEIGAGTQKRKIKVLTLYIKTGELVVSENEWAGNIMMVVNGIDTSAKIYENEGSDTVAGTTLVRLENGFFRDGETAPVPAAEIEAYVEGFNFRCWWVEVVQNSDSRLVSHFPVDNFPAEGGSPVGTLTTWNSDAGRVVDNSNLLLRAYQFGVPAYGFHPGFDLVTNPRQVSGSGYDAGRNFFPLQPASVTILDSFIENGSGTMTGITLDSNTFPADDTDGPNLYDKVVSTAYAINASTTPTNTTRQLVIQVEMDIEIPQQGLTGAADLTKLLDDFTLAMDLEIGVTSADREIQVQCQVQAVDFLGGVSGVINTRTDNIHGKLPPNLVIADGDTEKIETITPSYFGEPRLGPTPFRNWVNINLKGVLTEAQEFSPITHIRATFIVKNIVDPEDTFSISFQLNEVCFYRMNYIAEIPDDLQAKVRGERFGGESGEDTGTIWDGRRESDDPVLNIVDAVEHILRNYDGAASYVDTTTFDAVKALVDSNMVVGRSVIEQRNSHDYLKDLCKHGNFCLVPFPDGKRGMYVVGGNGSQGTEINESQIVQGSLGKVQFLPVQYSFNEIEAKYDWNESRGEFMKTMFAKNTDQAAFPAATDLLETDGDGDTEPVAGIFYDDTRGYVHVYVSGASTLGANARPGMKMDLVGGNNGFAFTEETAVNAWYNAAVDQYIIAFFEPGNFAVLDPGTNPGGGTIAAFKNRILKWKSWVGGVNQYTEALGLWNALHAAYLKTGAVNKLSVDLPWFSSSRDWGSGFEDPPYYLLMELALNYFDLKAELKLKLPLTVENLSRKVGSRALINDQILTATESGAFSRLSQISDLKLDTDLNELEITVIFNDMYAGA